MAHASAIAPHRHAVAAPFSCGHAVAIRCRAPALQHRQHLLREQPEAARRDLERSDTPRDVLARRLGWEADAFARWEVRAASVAEARAWLATNPNLITYLPAAEADAKVRVLLRLP